MTQLHLDARRPGVLVPEKFRAEHHLVLSSLVSLLADGRRMQLDPQSLALSPAEPAPEQPARASS